MAAMLIPCTSVTNDVEIYGSVPDLHVQLRVSYDDLFLEKSGTAPRIKPLVSIHL